MSNRVYGFIDASNLWAAQKAKQKLFDFAKLERFIQTEFKATSLRIFYYTAYPAEGTRKYSLDGKHKFLTYLRKGLKFEVRKKELKRISIIDGNGEAVQEKGNMDVEMTIDAVHNLPHYDTAVLFSGDSDFLALVTYLRNRGKKVFIVSSKNNVSRELRTGADGYSDVLDVTADIWGKDLVHR